MNPFNIKIFSFFSGSGLLDLGFDKVGFDIVFVNEYFKPFIEAYKFSREQMRITAPEFGYFDSDINEFFSSNKEILRKCISKVKSRDQLVGFIGGPPCPDFSIAGKNAGRHGDNGKLSKSYFELIIENKPDFFLFENVKGLWKTKRHREFYEEMKSELIESGYALSENLINSIEYGAPQDRERIILVGFSKSILKNHQVDGLIQEFPWNKHKIYNKDEVFGFDWPKRDQFTINQNREKPNNIIEELTVEYWFHKNNVVHHPNGIDFFTPRAGIIRMTSVEEGDSDKKSYKRLHRWRYSPTVAYGNNEVHLHPYFARRLSVAEAMALQSLPKEFQLPENMTLTDKFKTIGNGVPFLAAKGIASTILDFIGGSYETNCK